MGVVSNYLFGERSDLKKQLGRSFAELQKQNRQQFTDEFNKLSRKFTQLEASYADRVAILESRQEQLKLVLFESLKRLSAIEKGAGGDGIDKANIEGVTRETGNDTVRQDQRI